MRTTLFSLAFLTFFGGMTAQNTLVDRVPTHGGGFLSMDPVETPLIVAADLFVLNDEVALGELKLYGEFVVDGNPDDDIEGLNVWIFENDGLLPAGYPDEPGSGLVELTQIPLDKFTIQSDPEGRSDSKIISVSFTEANDGEQIVLQPGNYWLVAAPMINNPISAAPNINLWHWGVSLNSAPIAPLLYDPANAAGVGATDWTEIASIVSGFPAFAWHLTDEEKILSTGDHFADSFSVYPNPATDVLHIRSGENERIDRVAVYNLTGQMIVENRFAQQIDVAHLPVGVYLIEIESNGASVTKKFIKK